jgi:RNA polymerase sigma-70 factor (ECF subfamily)
VAQVDIEALYRQYGPMVQRRCRALLREPQQAEDAMHDVFVRLLQYRAPLDDRAMSGLLYRIATQVSLNRLRGRRRRAEDAGEELLLRIASAEDLEEHGAGSHLLARLFGREQESTRLLAVLHHVDGMTLEEVAAEVGMSVSGVRKRLRGLAERIGSRVEEAGDDT